MPLGILNRLNGMEPADAALGLDLRSACSFTELKQALVMGHPYNRKNCGSWRDSNRPPRVTHRNTGLQLRSVRVRFSIVTRGAHTLPTALLKAASIRGCSMRMPHGGHDPKLDRASYLGSERSARWTAMPRQLRSG